MTQERNYQGRFAEGNHGGPGRPKRPTQEEYLKALRYIVSLEDLRAIARRAVADAKKGSIPARDWVTRYLLGDPAPSAHFGTDERKLVSQSLLQIVREEMFSEREEAKLEGQP